MQRSQHTKGWWHALLLAVLLFISAVPANAAEQKTEEPTKTPAPSSLKTIPIAEIATRAAEVSNLLSAYRAKLLRTVEIETIQKLVSQASENIDLELTATRNILRERPTLEQLQTQQESWQRRQQQLTGWLKLLTARATELQGILMRLADLGRIWSATRGDAETAKAPASTLEQIDATLTAIGATPISVREQRAIVLDLQSQVAQQVARCANVLAQIDQFQKQAVAGILVRDSPPIWNAELWTKAATNTLSERVRKIAITYWEGIVTYFRDPSQRMHLHLGLFIILAFVFSAARRQIDHWAAAGEMESSTVRVLDRPFAASLFLTLFFVTSPFSEVSITVKEVLRILAFVPMILLIQPVIKEPLAPGLYAWALLFAIDNIRQTFAGAPLIGQVILMCETLVGMFVARWMLNNMRPGDPKSEVSSRFRLLRLVIFLCVFTFAIALVATITGYIRLASLFTSGIIGAGAMALTLYASVWVATGLVACALRVWPLRALRMVLNHRSLLERRVYHLLLWMAVLGWLARYLDYVGLWEPAKSCGTPCSLRRLSVVPLASLWAISLPFFSHWWRPTYSPLSSALCLKRMCIHGHGCQPVFRTPPRACSITRFLPSDSSWP